MRSRKIGTIEGVIGAGVVCLLLGMALSGAAAAPHERPAPARAPSLDEATAKLAAARVPFIENRGQVGNDAVSFYARTLSGTVFVTGDGALVYALPAESRRRARARPTHSANRSRDGMPCMSAASSRARSA